LESCESVSKTFQKRKRKKSEMQKGETQKGKMKKIKRGAGEI